MAKPYIPQQHIHRVGHTPPQPVPGGEIQLQIPRQHSKADPRGDQPRQRRRGVIPGAKTSLQRAEDIPPPPNSGEDATGTVPVGTDTAKHGDHPMVQCDSSVPLLLRRTRVVEAGEEGDQRLETCGALLLEETEGVVEEVGVEGGVEGAECRVPG